MGEGRIERGKGWGEGDGEIVSASSGCLRERAREAHGNSQWDDEAGADSGERGKISHRLAKAIID